MHVVFGRAVENIKMKAFTSAERTSGLIIDRVRHLFPTLRYGTPTTERGGQYELMKPGAHLSSSLYIKPDKSCRRKVPITRSRRISVLHTRYVRVSYASCPSRPGRPTVARYSMTIVGQPPASSTSHTASDQIRRKSIASWAFGWCSCCHEHVWRQH